MHADRASKLNAGLESILGTPLISELNGGITLEYRVYNITIVIYANIIHLYCYHQMQQHYDFGIGVESLTEKLSDETFILCTSWEQAIEQCIEHATTLTKK